METVVRSVVLLVLGRREHQSHARKTEQAHSKELYASRVLFSNQRKIGIAPGFLVFSGAALALLQFREDGKLRREVWGDGEGGWERGVAGLKAD